MQAHLLTLNAFNQPKVLSDSYAAYTNIIYLILLTKGKYQSHPDMGVGLRERFRHSNADNFMKDLQDDIRDQIERFLPELDLIDISLSYSDADHLLGIIINTANGAYAMTYDSNKETINVNSTYSLQDL